MGIRIISKPLSDEAARAAKESMAFRGRVWAVLRKVSFDGERLVKRQMPIDTGRARASWGNWDDKVTLGKRRLKGRKGAHNAPASAWKQLFGANKSDSIFEADESKLRITQGSNLPYIEVLNAGHSRQAPSGFLDVIAAKMTDTLDAALVELAKQL